jgi:phosphoenolpyruvate carboxykinase (GTP)
MSMRPFLAYHESDYAAHWLKIVGAATHQPVFAHVNWFQKDLSEGGDGHFLWPGYRENLRALLWLCRFHDGDVSGVPTPVGVVPTEEELDLTGLDLPQEDLDRILTIDVPRWRQEMGFREEHLKQFDDLPEAIWTAHRRVAQALDQES